MAKNKPVKAIDAYMGKSSTRKAEKLDLTVVGLKYRLSDRELEQIEDFIDEEGGIAARLEREPENEVDPKAVKVVLLDPKNKVFHNWHIGYIRRPSNSPLSDLLRRGGSVKMCLLTWVDSKSGEGELEVALIPPSE